MSNPPGNRIGDAPKVRAQAGDPVALVATGLTPGNPYVVYIKQPGGDYGTLGTVIGSTFSALPVFEASRRGTVVLAMKDVVTGATQYIKVRVR